MAKNTCKIFNVHGFVVINPHPASIRVRFSSPECSAIYSGLGLGLEIFSQGLCLETKIKIATVILNLDLK